MLEKDIEKKVCEYARSKGILCYKFSSPNHAGVPDRLFFAPIGQAFFIEFKREGGECTPLQDREIRRFQSYGFRVYVVDTVESGKKIIDNEKGISDMITMLATCSDDDTDEVRH